MTNLIAVYGTLRKEGRWNKYWLPAEAGVDDDLLKDHALYVGHLPFCVEKEGESVIVEIYDINDELFDALNRFETNAGYESVIVNDKLDRVYDKRVTAWVYKHELPKGASPTDGDYIQFMKNRGTL